MPVTLKPSSDLKLKPDQRIHRWSFEAVVSDSDRETKTFAIPGMTLGTKSDGRGAAERLQSDISQEMQQGDITVRVRPVMHERISQELVIEYHRIGSKARIYENVARSFAERLKYANREIDFRSSEEILHDEVRKIVGAKAKPQLEVIPTYKEDPPVEEQPRRRLGIDAVNEILSAPASDEGSA
jgi:hypothetical protein